MDIRILTLLLFIGVTASFAELRSPFFRARRNGLQENDRPLVTEFAAVSRTKRESSNSNTTKGTTVPTSTPDPTTVPLTDSESTSSEKTDPMTESTESDSSELTSSPTPDSSSTTANTPESSPKTVSPPTSVPRNKPKATTSEAESTTPRSIDKSTKPEATTIGSTSPAAESTKPKSESTTSDPSTESVTGKSETVPPSPTTTPGTSSPTAATSSPPTTKPATPKATSTKSDSNTTPATTTTTTPSKATSGPTAKKPSNSGKPSKPASTTAAPMIGSRFNPDDETPVSIKNPKDETQGPIKGPEAAPNANQGPVGGYPVNPEFPTFPFTPFFVPNFVPDFSYPSYPYSDPTFNSIPAVGNNNAWTGPSNGGGFASSFASASASAGAGGNSNYNPAPLVYRGGFPEQPNAAVVSTTAVEPNMANMANTMPNMPGVAGAGGYGYGGDVPFFDPNSFAFPGYNLDNLQKQMEDHFKHLQAQFQRQQQAIFEASNRIGATDGSSGPGPHTAYSGISLGPGGGYQAGAINPVAPGVESRFGEELPAPSGNSYGVFSSSSSHTLVGPDGKTVSHKSSTTGVNDNGKITFRTVQD